MLHPGLPAHVAANPQDRLLGHGLDAGGQVHVPLLQGRLRRARRAAQETMEPSIGHRQPLAVLEIVHVEPEAAVGFEVHQMLEDQVPVDRLPVRGQTHQLVFAAVDLEAAIVGKRRIQQAQRVGERDVVDQADAIPFADTVGGRAPLADPVQGHDRRPVEGAREKRAGGMALMMIGEDQPGTRRPSQTAAQGPPHVQLVLEPQRHRQAKTAEPRRREGQVGLQQALELGQRFVIKGNIVQVLRRDSAFLQTIAESLRGECRIMLDPGEPLLLGRGDDPAVDHQSGGAVVIESGNPQDRGHPSLPLSVTLLARVSGQGHTIPIITEGGRVFPCR